MKEHKQDEDGDDETCCQMKACYVVAFTIIGLLYLGMILKAVKK